MIHNRLFRLFPAVAILAIGTILGGCAATAGAGAATGVAAYQERGIETAAHDLKLEMKIANLWLNSNKYLLIKASIEVYESRVMLTGVLDNEKMRATAVRLAWKVDGVKDVINEIQIASHIGIMDMARDSWITARLKINLTVDENIMAINYAIETVNGIVYLIGIAQDQNELDRAISQARNIEYVHKVISHVRVKNKA